MSTDTQQLNNQESSAQTPIKLEAGQRVTARIEDIQSFVEPVNALLKPEKRLTNVVSLSEITQVLVPANLNLKDEVIELNPSTEPVSTIIKLEEDSEYIGFNSITVRTKPLENRVVPILTPDMLNVEGGLTITKTSDDFCGMNQVEIQDIALASNLEYTIVPSDLTTENNNTIIFDFQTFDKFSSEIQSQYVGKVFGAKDLVVNVPLVEEHIFVVDSTMLGKTYVPADIPEDFDGTGGKAAKLGFKRVGISAKLNSTLTRDEVITYMTNSTSSDNVTTVSGGNNSLGYPAIEIPPVVSIGINLANYIKSSSTESTEIFSFTPKVDEHDLNEFTSAVDAVGVYSLTLQYPDKIDLDLSTDLGITEKEKLVNNILVNGLTSASFCIDFSDIEKSDITLPNNLKLAGPTIGQNLLNTLSIPLPPTFKIEIEIASTKLTTSNADNLNYINSLISANKIVNYSESTLVKPIISDFFITKGIPTSAFTIDADWENFSVMALNGSLSIKTTQQFTKNPFLNFNFDFSTPPPPSFSIAFSIEANITDDSINVEDLKQPIQFPLCYSSNIWLSGGLKTVTSSNNILFKSSNQNINWCGSQNLSYLQSIATTTADTTEWQPFYYCNEDKTIRVDLDKIINAKKNMTSTPFLESKLPVVFFIISNNTEA